LTVKESERFVLALPASHFKAGGQFAEKRWNCGKLAIVLSVATIDMADGRRIIADDPSIDIVTEAEHIFEPILRIALPDLASKPKKLDLEYFERSLVSAKKTREEWKKAIADQLAHSISKANVSTIKDCRLFVNGVEIGPIQNVEIRRDFTGRLQYNTWEARGFVIDDRGADALDQAFH
jgi:hypothetical protein